VLLYQLSLLLSHVTGRQLVVSTEVKKGCIIEEKLAFGAHHPLAFWFSSVQIQDTKSDKESDHHSLPNSAKVRSVEQFTFWTIRIVLGSGFTVMYMLRALKLFSSRWLG
jgi:hypothetical protein